MAGYGKSDKPHGSSTHIEFSKRVMADDMVQLMYVPVPSLQESSAASLGNFSGRTGRLILGIN
jgi:hypothetical protein